MVCKPGTNEIESVSVWTDKLSNLILRKICTVSETKRGA